MTENMNHEGRPDDASAADQTRVNPPAVSPQAAANEAGGGQSAIAVAQAAAEAARMAAEAAQAAATAVGSVPVGSRYAASAPAGYEPAGSVPATRAQAAAAHRDWAQSDFTAVAESRREHGRKSGGMLSHFGKLPAASGIGTMQNPAAPPKKPVDPKVQKRRMVAIGLVMPLFMAIFMPLIMTGLFTGSGEPRHMDVALIGTSQLVKDQTKDLDKTTVNRFDVTRVANVEDAKTQIREHDIRAAYNPKTGEMFYAGANGSRVTQAVTELFTTVAADDGKTLTSTDVVKTTADDSSGTTVVFLGLGALLGGFMTGMLLGIIPVPGKLRVALGIAIPAVVATAEIIYGWTVFGVCDGNAVGPWCMLFLLSFSCLAVTMGGILTFGPVWMPIAMVACSMLGMSTSGVTAPLDLISPFFAGVHPWLFSSQGFSALRDSVYFTDAGFVQPVLVMLAWIVGGILLAVLGTLRQKKRHFDAELNKVEEAETAMAVAAVL